MAYFTQLLCIVCVGSGERRIYVDFSHSMIKDCIFFYNVKPYLTHPEYVCDVITDRDWYW